jgi:DNA-binding transcriptional LysR family regulator
MFSLHRLRLLVELRRRGTLNEVARALSYSQSTVSQQLAQLEIEAGVPLLEPVGRRVRLTPGGDILVRHAEKILAQVERAHSELAALESSVVGQVRVATFQTAALSLIPALLTELEARHPGVEVHVSEIQPDASVAALMARDFDLVLGEEYPGLPPAPPARIHRQELLADPMRLYVPPAIKRTSLSDLGAHAWVMEPVGKPARAWAEAQCRAAGFEPDVRFESADLLVHVELTNTGHAVSLIPDLMWAFPRPRDGNLQSLPGAPSRSVYTAVREGGETNPVHVAFRSLLQEVSQVVRARADLRASAPDSLR